MAQHNNMFNVLKPTIMKKLNPNHQVIQRLLEKSPRGTAWMRMFFMLILMMMSSALAQAQETYGFSIAGVEVTSENCADLSVIPGVEGNLSYDPETRTLTMQDVTIETSGGRGILIYSNMNFTIKVLGNNSISTDYGCIINEIPCTISGSGTLRLRSSLDAGLLTLNSLTIRDVKLYIEGRNGIAGQKSVTDSDITISKAYVEVYGYKGSICTIESLTLNKCVIVNPRGANFDADSRSLVLNGETISDKVVIEPIKGYGIKVAGVEVTNVNCIDLSVIKGVEGKMSYNPETKALAMEDVTISSFGDNHGLVIYDNEDVKIEVAGTNSITTDGTSLSSRYTSTIIGSGSIRLKSTYGAGLNVNASATVEGVNITVEGVNIYTEGRWGICGFTGTRGEVLTLRNAYVEATGSEASIATIENLILDGCAITQPAGAAFDANEHAVMLDGQKVKSKVIIEPIDYGIKVAGVIVTNTNCSDLSVIEGVSGKVSFDPDTKTLTLDNATIVSANEVAIHNKKCDGLVIKVLGENNITATDKGGIYVVKPTTILGGGGSCLLNVKSNIGALAMFKVPLTIQDCAVTAVGNFAISGGGYDEDVLTIRNSRVEAKGGEGEIYDYEDYGSIAEIANLVLEGCSITQPQGAKFDAELRAVVKDGWLTTDKVVIEPDASGINDITADVPARKKGVFTVQGVKQTQSWNELPAGVYIVDGVKRVKR